MSQEDSVSIQDSPIATPARLPDNLRQLLDWHLSRIISRPIVHNGRIHHSDTHVDVVLRWSQRLEGDESDFHLKVHIPQMPFISGADCAAALAAEVRPIREFVAKVFDLDCKFDCKSNSFHIDMAWTKEVIWL